MISMCSVMLELLKGALEAESLVKPFFLMIGLQVRKIQPFHNTSDRKQT